MFANSEHIQCKILTQNTKIASGRNAHNTKIASGMAEVMPSQPSVHFSSDLSLSTFIMF